MANNNSIMPLSDIQSSPYIIDRPSHLAEQVVVVDGLIGGGKGLLSAITGSFPRSEMWVHKPHIEQICGLHHLGHINIDSASALIRTWTDEEIYNLSMGRNVNCRPKDKSSIFHDAHPWRYIKRLISKGDAESLKRIGKEKPILNLMTHAISGYSEPLFEAIGERMVFVRFTRHPCSEYMLNHVSRWSTRWGNDVRNGMLLYKLKNGNNYIDSVPFYMKGFEQRYLDSNPMDRAIMLLERWQNMGDEVIDRLQNDTVATIIEIPYEKFVFKPLPYVKVIAGALETEVDKAVLKMMKRHKVPRKSLTDAPESKLYRSLGWVPPKKIMTLAQEFAEGRAYAAETASPDALVILDNLAMEYEQRHGLIDD